MAPARSSWRRLRERGSLRVIELASSVDEAGLMVAVDKALSDVDAIAAESITQRNVPRETAHNQGRIEFARLTRKICVDALEHRDLRMARAAQQSGVDGLCSLQLLGQLLPIDLRPREVPLATALSQFVGALDYTRDMRAHDMCERLAREVSVQRGRVGRGRLPQQLALPELSGLLSANDVARVRDGGVTVIDTSWLDADGLRTAERDLGAYVRTSGLQSVSSCNTHAVTTDVPLLGDSCNFAPSTIRLLRLLAGVPAAIEEHGWPRELRIPSLLQLASYSSTSRARYSPHYDNNPWEKHNKREVTILLYLNTDWDVERMGGSLRVHPSEGEGVQAAVQDVEPIAGRLVLFHSRLVRHEVLQCTAGERVALTLWVDHV